MEKTGWITWFTGNTNKTPRQGVSTTYIGHRRLSVLPKERTHWGLPGQISEAQAKLAGLASIYAPDENSARRGKKEQHGGISLSRNWSNYFIFRFAYIPFVTHRDKWKFQSHAGVSSPDLYPNQVLRINVYKKIFRGFTSSSGYEACWHFMILSFLITVSQPETYFPGAIFLKPGTTLWR